MNVHIYPKDPESFSESPKTVESTQPSALSSKERPRNRGAGTSLLHAQPCNGIASGKRLEADGSLYPSNHDRIRVDMHGTSLCPWAPLGLVCQLTGTDGTTGAGFGHRIEPLALGKTSRLMEEDGRAWQAEHHLTMLVLWGFAGSPQAAAKPPELNNLNLVRSSPAGGSLKQLNVLPEISPALLDLQREAEALLPNSTTAQPRDSTHEPKLPNRSLD